MANDETPGSPKESLTKKTEAAAGAQGATITQGQTETEQEQQQQAGTGQTTSVSTDAPPSMAARVIGLATYNKNVRRVAGWTLTCLIFGLLLAAIGAWTNWVSAVLWSGACSAFGWVLGFLFGIPRTLQNEGQAEVTQTERETPSDNTTRSVTARRSTGINTNLEQISDWLTKILVGVTLVQLSEVNATLNSAAALIAESLGANMRSFAYALMLYFALTGFLGSYLLTRMFLQRAFEEDF